MTAKVAAHPLKPARHRGRGQRLAIAVAPAFSGESCVQRTIGRRDSDRLRRRRSERTRTLGLARDGVDFFKRKPARLGRAKRAERRRRSRHDHDGWMAEHSGYMISLCQRALRSREREREVSFPDARGFRTARSSLTSQTGGISQQLVGEGGDGTRQSGASAGPLPT